MDDLDGEERARLTATIAWLDNASSEDRHRAALDFNWGEPLYLIDWIVRHPDCDIATALTVFWTAEPGYWMSEGDTRDEEPNGFSYLNRQICIYLADRIRAGGYTRSRIAFVPDVFRKKSYVDLVAAEQATGRPIFRTHPDLIRNRRGRRVENDAAFYRRYPADFHYSFYFDDDNLVDSPHSIAVMAQVKRIEAMTLRLLPAWLRS